MTTYCLKCGRSENSHEIRHPAIFVKTRSRPRIRRRNNRYRGEKKRIVAFYGPKRVDKTRLCHRTVNPKAFLKSLFHTNDETKTATYRTHSKRKTAFAPEDEFPTTLQTTNNFITQPFIYTLMSTRTQARV